MDKDRKAPDSPAMTDRKKPGWPFWATVVVLVVLPILYVLSFGPVCWLAEREIIPISSVEACRPLAKIAARCPDAVLGAYMRYVSACTPESAGVSFGCLMIKDEYMRHLTGDDDYPMNNFSR